MAFNMALGWLPVYKEGSNGVGGFDLQSPDDRVFTFDYDHSGKLDHIVLYRPGTGAISILKHDDGNFSPVYVQGDPGQGIGGYDLKSVDDRAFAFDYEHSGKLDYLALYRPGTGTFWILYNNCGVFTPVYQEGDPGNGIGGYDLSSIDDKAFAFDYNQNGHLDHIVLYRPGTGSIWILKNDKGKFSPVYRQGDPGNGIGGYDLKSKADRAFAFDYQHNGKLDHIVLFRPGKGKISILKNNVGKFSSVYQDGNPGSGIGGYDLLSQDDNIIAFDYDRSGQFDHLVLYRPGTGKIWILKHGENDFSAVYNTDVGGIGAYDLKSRADKAFAYDYTDTGKSDYLGLYRPGTGIVWILKHT